MMTIRDDIRIIDLIGGPPGAHGFRKGKWLATYRDRTFKFFGTVPHSMELSDQYDMLKSQAAVALETLLSPNPVGVLAEWCDDPNASKPCY
jgi:hypothetical protein